MNSLYSIALATCFAVSFASAKEPLPAIPMSSIEQYTVTIEKELLESMLMDRLILTGHNRIMTDPIRGHYNSPTNGRASASFRIEHGPQYAVDFFCFPKTAFPYPIDDDTLNSYLEGLTLKYQPEKQFEIVEASAFSSSGTSKFRIMGVRAHLITYQYVDAEETKHVSEAWARHDDHIYVVRIESPRENHSEYVEELRLPFSIMDERE